MYALSLTDIKCGLPGAQRPIIEHADAHRPNRGSSYIPSAGQLILQIFPRRCQPIHCGKGSQIDSDSTHPRNLLCAE